MSTAGGIGIQEFNQMLSFLPKDSKILGFDYDGGTSCQYIFVGSDIFKDVPDGMIPTDIIPNFNRDNSGIITCTGFNFSDAVLQCVHVWKEYVGVMNRFNYCTKCNKKDE